MRSLLPNQDHVSQILENQGGSLVTLSQPITKTSPRLVRFVGRGLLVIRESELLATNHPSTRLTLRCHLAQGGGVAKELNKCLMNIAF